MIINVIILNPCVLGSQAIKGKFIMAGEGSKKTQFKSTGVGLVHNSRALSFKIPYKYEDIILSLPNRSQKIREWVIQGMLREGLIEDNEYDDNSH